MSSNLAQRVKVRRAEERGHDDYDDWLDSFHTFSFGAYHDPRFTGFSSLRVLNEDRVAGGQGFDKHPHSNYEIFTYVISGSVEHRDTLANHEVIKRGGVQFTSAGRGIAHSEYNHSRTKPVHFLQVWLKPDRRDLEPGYQMAGFADEDKHGRLCLIVASRHHLDDNIKSNKSESESEKAMPVIGVNQDAQVYASMLAKDESVSYSYGQERCGYLHVCQTGGRLSLRLLANGDDSGWEEEKDEIVLKGGDGVFIQAGTRLQMIGANASSTVDKRVEFLLFDLVKEEKDNMLW